MPKNIVIFSDGTGQEGGEGNSTNVYKLFNMITDRTPKQIAFYDRGLGTGWRKFTGQAFGLGISKNIQECYEFIFENYEIGDKIYLFGFSRGAFTVRSLSGFMELFGVLPKSRKELIGKAYKIYKIRNPARRQKACLRFLGKHHTIPCEIEFIGVWDTVKALGISIHLLEQLNPFKNRFHNAKLCKNVKNGFHALSIDDERLTFHPTIWDETKIENYQTIEQVWFAGVHTDVGGGYKEDGLSDITLQWMVEKAKSKKLLIDEEHTIAITPNPFGLMHDSRKGWARLFRRKVRHIDTAKMPLPCIHESVQARKNNPELKYNPWIFKNNPKMVSL